MFVGHYGVSFAAKKADPSIPVWVLFLAVQLLDVGWGILVLLGVEKTRIVPGFTASNPFDLYYMPYTHSLVAAVVWSVAAAVTYKTLARPAGGQAGLVVGLAVFSHWVCDLIVHRPDLPLYDNSAKIGLGLWDHPALAFGLEVALLLWGLLLYFRSGPPRRAAILGFGAVMFGCQAFTFFGPPPASDKAFAATALAFYAAFALIIWFLADRPRPAPLAG